MTKLAGARLEEMADIRSTRKKKIVSLCCGITALSMGIGSLLHYSPDNPTQSLLYALCAFACTSNFYAIKHYHYHHADLILSGILLLAGLLLFLFDHSAPGHLLWLFPILAAIILINEFQLGLWLSLGFCLAVSLGIHLIQPQHLEFGRFMLTLIATCVVCHTFSYYYTKVLNYIQTLYREGIEELAYLDQLTGLANRWSFEKWARTKLAQISRDRRGPATVTALVFLDIDNFKRINDSFGHEAGDRVLRHFATRLKKNLRSRSKDQHQHDYSIARFAGDEFVLLLYGVRNKQDLDGILQRIVNLFGHGYYLHEEMISLTTSVGAAIYQQDANDLAELTRCADKAMYTAKHNGKNQFAYYENGEYPANLSHQVQTETNSNVTPLRR
ncbi:GGDEF domain-containing protein [Vibrio sp. CAU 1672]|uniref:GGDEF domain-containing protein n=1 Tax=Vibrio sp. CAU 1672 TaxID=3032594 RepID=UPI0023DC5C4A|nr:GGDEF domain-containing protein [Vibrio sp. CAU 1672]MDF2155204.1 GGDEF domain-containing protein [Vibrio sp. CAU 1672]